MASMDKTPSETTFFLFVHDISNIHKTSRPQVKLFGGRVSKRLIHFPRTVKKITSSHLGAVRRRYDKQGISIFSTVYVRVHAVSVNETGNRLYTHFSQIMGVSTWPPLLFWNGPFHSAKCMHVGISFASFLQEFLENLEKKTGVAKHCQEYSNNDHIQNS